MPTRIQLSLFVPPHLGADVEAIRAIVDPVQQRLIPAHVTLCREDELGQLSLDDLRARLRHAHGPLTLEFGAPERFGDHGILMPSIGGTEAFQTLREVALGVPSARSHAPHLTLAHPRNPKAPGNDLSAAAALGAGRHITFDAVQLVEQVDDSPWRILGRFSLNPEPGPPPTPSPAPTR